jgi:hypothetical protein
VGAITIENTASDQSILKFRLYVDGIEAWSSVLLSPSTTTGSSRSKDIEHIWVELEMAFGVSCGLHGVEDRTRECLLLHGICL